MSDDLYMRSLKASDPVAVFADGSILFVTDDEEALDLDPGDRILVRLQSIEPPETRLMTVTRTVREDGRTAIRAIPALEERIK